MSSNLEAAITLKASVEQFAAGINSAVTSFTGAMARIEGAAEQTGSATEQALEKIGIRRHAEIEADIQAVENAYRQLAESGELTGRELAQASQRMQESVAELRQETGSWVASLGKMQSELAAAGKALSGIGGVLKSAAGESMRFGTAMAEVSTLMDDVSGLDQMSDAVRRLTVEFGGDATENAKALYDVVLAGANDSTEAIATLTAANKLAVGGVTEVKVAAEGLSSTMSAYGIAAGDAATVSDAFFVAVKAGKTNVAELSSTIGQVAPTAAAAGVSLDELLASVATLTAGGVKTGQAMTQIQAALTGVIEPSTEAAKLAEELGLRFDAGALKAKGWAGFLEDVRTATGGNVETMERLFGSVDGLDAVLELTGQGLDKFGESLEQMTGKAGTTEAAVDKLMDTPAKRVELFQAAMRDLNLALGDAVSAFTPLLSSITDLVNVVNDLPGPLKTAVVGLGAAVVAAPAILIALGSIANAWRILRGAATLAAAETAVAAPRIAGALQGAAAASSAAAGAFTVLRTALRGALVISAVAGVVEIVSLVSNLVGLYKQTEKLKEAEDELAKTQDKLAARYRELSDRTGVAVSNTDEFNAAVAAGKLVFDDATTSWVAGGAALEKVAKTTRQLADELIRADAAKLVATFDEIIKKGGDVESALKGIAESLEFGQDNGVAAFTQALAELESSSTISAKNVGEAWRLALAELSTGEVNAFALIVQQAFEDNKISAEQFAQINNEVLGASFKRLGIDGEVALGRISQSSQDAINSVDRIVEALDNAKVGAQQSAIAIELALTQAFAAADNQPALDQLNQRMAELAKQGKLGADAMTRLGQESAKARARVDEMGPGINSVAEAFRELGVTSKAALTEAARAAREAYDVIANSGKAGPREIADAWLEYAKRAIAANEGVASASLKAEAAALGQEAALKKLLAAANPLSEQMKAIAESMDATIKAAERSTQVTERKAAADLRAAQTTLELAKAKGDEAEITKAQIALAETQLQGSRRIAAAKEAEASAADKKVSALKKEAQADGQVTDAEKEAIATAEDAAAAKRDTAEASRDKAKADEAELEKVRELAEGQKEAAKQVAEAVDGTVVDLEKGIKVPWLTGAAAASQYADEAIEAAKRVALSWSTSVNPYEKMETYARHYITTLEDIDARQSALNSTAGDGVEDLRLQLLRLEGTKAQIDAAEKARDIAKVERNIQLMRLEIERARLRGDTAEVARLEAEVRLLKEQLVLIDKIHKAEQRKEKGQSGGGGGGGGLSYDRPPPSGGGGAEKPAPPVTVVIEGLLDISDRGSLEALSRRLGPVLADLTRRGV